MFNLLSCIPSSTPSMQDDGSYPETTQKRNKDQHFLSPNSIVAWGVNFASLQLLCHASSFCVQCAHEKISMLMYQGSCAKLLIQDVCYGKSTDKQKKDQYFLVTSFPLAWGLLRIFILIYRYCAICIVQHEKRSTVSSAADPVQTFGAGCAQQRHREQEQPEEGPTYSVTLCPAV